MCGNTHRNVITTLKLGTLFSTSLTSKSLNEKGKSMVAYKTNIPEE